jgi:hypothetical protein
MRQTIALPPPLTSPRARDLCRLRPAPAAQRSFPTLSLPIYPYVSGPLLRWPPGCLHPFLPPGHWPSPRLNRVGASQIPQQPLQLGSRFRSCSHSLMFRPARLLATPVAPTLTPCDAGQPWLLHPRISRFVTPPCSGFANRPNRVIGGKGTRTPQNRQPCRLLLKQAMRRAGITSPSRGAAHVLRHSAATSMLRQGASLQDIATILRHRSIESTQIYSKVDVATLQRIAQPWPEVQPC